MKKEIVRNISVNIIAQIITAVAGFILPPLIISTYGSAQNGMAASIGQFIAYLALVEAGISGVSVAAILKPLYNNDKNKINSILAATQNFYSKAGSIFVFLVFLLAFVYPQIVEGVDKLSAGLMVLVFGIGGAFDFFILGKYRVLLIADRKFFIISIIKIIAVIFNTIVSVILIKSGYSFLFVKFVSVLVYTSITTMTLIYVKKHYKFINLKTKFGKNTLEQKWDVMYHRAAAMVLENSPLVLLTIFCTLYDVSIYSIYAMIFLAVGQLVDTFSDGMQGFFGRFLAEENPQKLKKNFGKYETMYFSIVGIGYTCAIILIIPFMQIYAKNMTDANYIQPTLAALFVLVGVMNKVRGPATMLFLSAGHFKQTKWRAVAEAVINVSASIFFITKFGLIGALLGMVCSLAYRAPDLIIYSSKHIVHNNLLLTIGKFLLWGIWYSAGYFILSNFVISDIENYFDFARNAAVSLVFLSIPAGIYILINGK